MKIILSTVVLFVLLYAASAQIKPLDTRKHFQFTDTSFEVGEVKTLSRIFYIVEDSFDRPQPIPSLDSLGNFLRLHPEIHIEIGHHVDDRGNHKYNLKLTDARARYDYDYLIRNGVPYWQLAFRGYGETQPIAPNEINGKANLLGQQQNRRTEVKIISISPPQKSLDTRKHFEFADTLFEVGEIKILCSIYFNYDYAGIRPESAPSLDSILNFLYYNPELKVEVGNHTDNKGKDNYNLRLSQARSQAVVYYLISRGMPPDRLAAKGYGETLPIMQNEIDGNDNPEGRELNRRTELKIISIDPVKENFIRPALLNPQPSLIHFLFGENSSAFTLSLFHVRAIENVMDSNNEPDSSFITQYRSFARSYVGFIDAAGDSMVMAVINFSAPHQNQRNSLFDSNALGKTQSIFINLSKKICLKSFQPMKD